MPSLRLELMIQGFHDSELRSFRKILIDAFPAEKITAGKLIVKKWRSEYEHSFAEILHGKKWTELSPWEGKLLEDGGSFLTQQSLASLIPFYLSAMAEPEESDTLPGRFVYYMDRLSCNFLTVPQKKAIRYGLQLFYKLESKMQANEGWGWYDGLLQNFERLQAKFLDD